MQTRPPRVSAPLKLLIAGLAAVLVIAALSARRPSEAMETAPAMDQPGMSHTMSAGMTEEEMQAAVDAWFASNPVVGTSAQGVPVVTFKAFSTAFDYDGDLVGTVVDSVVVGVGDIVAWQRLIGSHTLTSGVDSNDSNAGTIFDVPLDSANPVFQWQYNAPGRYPFFCRVHELYNMRGVVIVVGATDTRRTTWGQVKAENR